MIDQYELGRAIDLVRQALTELEATSSSHAQRYEIYRPRNPHLSTSSGFHCRDAAERWAAIHCLPGGEETIGVRMPGDVDWVYFHIAWRPVAYQVSYSGDEGEEGSAVQPERSD